ncbi:MAG: MATE family efflux transporter [Aestuariivita sp.]|nr:MATE family efflux transporter [Aestuariivita sp.]MCY4346735.1 MATE family efflux transporter [Aestuariivita sp.]
MIAEHNLEAPSHRRILGIAIPIVIANATTPILGAVDTGVVGQLGEAVPIGAVGLGAIILTSVYWMFGFLRMGTVGLTSQALGMQDSAEVAALLARVLIAAFGFGLVLIVLQIPILRFALTLAPASAEVEELAKIYLQIRIWSAPAAIAVYGISGWLLAHERARSVLVLQIGMNGMNIILDVLFVLGFGWGVAGVAFATFLAEWSGALVGLWLCLTAFRQPLFFQRRLIFDLARLMNMAMVNADILVRSLLLQIIFTSFVFMSAGLGDRTLAANQVLLQFLYISAYALDGFAMAAEVLTGRAMGARRVGALRKAAIMASIWGLVAVILMASLFAMFGDLLIDTMTTATDVRIEAKKYLFWMLLAPIVGVGAWMLDGIFIGTTQTRDMRNMMALSFLIYWLAVLILFPLYSSHGLWAALLISFLVRGITLALCYPRIENRARG